MTGMAAPESGRVIAENAPPARPLRAGRRWRMKERDARRLGVVGFLALALAGWQLYSSHMPPVLAPSPARVMNRLVTMWSNPGFVTYAELTLLHVVASVAIAFCLGLAIALLAHFFPVLQRAVYGRAAPFLNSFPGVGWAFLSLVWFGINSKAVIFSSAIAMTPLALINIGAGLRELDRDTMEMATSFTRSAGKRIRLVMLPLLFPYIFATLRLCFGVSWQIVLVVELLCGAPGVGALISVARQRYWTDMIFAIAALILAVVYVTDRLILARLQDKIGKVYRV